MRLRTWMPDHSASRELAFFNMLPSFLRHCPRPSRGNAAVEFDLSQNLSYNQRIKYMLVLPIHWKHSWQSGRKLWPAHGMRNELHFRLKELHRLV